MIVKYSFFSTYYLKIMHYVFEKYKTKAWIGMYFEFIEFNICTLSNDYVLKLNDNLVQVLFLLWFPNAKLKLWSIWFLHI